MIFCLFYVSECDVSPQDHSQTIDDIFLVSREKNRRLDVTGALLFSGTHFAQLLEGPEQNVRSVMSSIACDPRHKKIHVLLEEPREARQFSSWSLAYSGPSTYVRRSLAPLIEPSNLEEIAPAVEDTVSIMRRFAEGR